MSRTVLVSTHRLDLAGALREAFQGEGYAVELVASPRETLEGVDEPVLLVLTGGEEAEEWARRAADELEIPLFTVFPGSEAEARGRRLGAVEAAGADADAADIALLGHRLVERRRLQRLTGIVGESDPIREALERVVQIAPVASTVLVTGESGTGKELVARGVHALSPRRHRPFLAVNVAALSDTLLESELFGHEKGAFTGAIDTRKGFFELAHKGTLFLDEIGEMPLSTQTKLLRVLEQGEFLRVGGERPIQVDVRIIAATNQELRTLVANGGFRRDLYYRLNVLNIELPPLRRRPSDIPLLIDHFVRDAASRMDRPFPGIDDEAMEIFKQYPWPGNVRELRNLVESMVVLAPGRKIGPEDIPREIRSPVEAKRLLPVPLSGRADDREGAVRGRSGDGEEERSSLRPELEFIFRTLVEMRVDMDELRRQFEAYRSETEERLDEVAYPSLPLSTLSSGVEVGVAASGAATPTDEELDPSSGHVEEEEAPRVVFRLGMTMEELEREAIVAVLEEMNGNRRKAAESLGIGERTLYRKLRRYEIDA